MNKIYGLDEWRLKETKADTPRFADVKIIIEYPDPFQFVELEPEDRLKQIDKFYDESIERLIAYNLFDTCNLINNNTRNIGVRAKIRYPDLRKLESIPGLSLIEIESIEFALKQKKKKVGRHGYFCVAMTVIVEVEGLTLKRETTEKRFVLIKAKSADDAFNKIELQKDAYAAPYLNSEGRFVRWVIESLDDCFETDIMRAADLDEPEGVEVYSKLGERKSRDRPVWNGR